MLKSHFYWFDQ